MSASKPLFERGRLTDWLLTTLLTPPLALAPKPILLGNAIAPDDGGWTGGQPGQGDFLAYAVLTTGPAAPLAKQPLGIAEPQDWTCRYQLRSVGALPEQTDWTADQVRKVWDGQREIKLDLGGPAQWKAYGFTVMSMGAMTRNDTTNPAYWELVDEVVVTLTR